MISVEITSARRGPLAKMECANCGADIRLEFSRGVSVGDAARDIRTIAAAVGFSMVEDPHAPGRLLDHCRACTATRHGFPQTEGDLRSLVASAEAMALLARRGIPLTGPGLAGVLDGLTAVIVALVSS